MISARVRSSIHLYGCLVAAGTAVLGCPADEREKPSRADTDAVAAERASTDSIVRGLVLGERTLYLDRNQNLDSVDVMLGVSRETSPVDGNAQSRCYGVRLRDAGTALLRVGTEDLGGTQRVVLWFEATLLEAGVAISPECARLSAASLSLRTDNGVQLNQRLQEVTAILGVPTSSVGDRLRYERLIERVDSTLAPEDPRRTYHETSRIELEFRNERLVRLRVSYFEVT